MNKIAFGGLIPYFVFSFYYHSYGMLLIGVNGLIFHSYPDNKLLYIYDFSTNAFLYSYTCFKYPFIIKYAILTVSFFIINNRYFSHNKNLCELIHVLFVQWFGLYLILYVYQHDNCYPLLFFCT